MANTNWHGDNPVYVDPPAAGLRPLGWYETRNGRRPTIPTVWAEGFGHSLRGAGERYAADILETESAGLSEWVADPTVEREAIRIDVSAPRLGCALKLAAEVIQGRGYFANVDTGFSVYVGEVEQRLSVTLFEVSLCGAYGFFAALRAKLRAAGYAVDCGRFYFEVDGRQTSHCAKRIAPRKFTLAAGLSLALETQTKGANYGRTEVYSSQDSGIADSGLA